MGSVREVSSDGRSHLGRYNFGNNRNIFRNPRGRKRWYSIYAIVGISASTNALLRYQWSEDGKNWEGETTIDTSDFTANSAAGYCMDVKIHDDGSQLEIFLVFVDNTGTGSTNPLHYVKGTVGDTADTITWGTTRTIDSAVDTLISATIGLPVAIAHTENDRLVVAFGEDRTVHGKIYRDIKLITGSDDSDNPTWANETTVVDSSASTNNEEKDDIWFGLEAFDATFADRVFFYCRTPESSTTTAYDVQAFVYTWNGSSLTQEASDTSVGTAGTTTGNVISGIIGSDDKCHVMFFDGGTDIDHVKFGTAGGLGTATTTAIATTSPSGMSVSIDRTTNDIFAFWLDGTDDIDYKLTDDTTTSWTAEVLMIRTSINVNDISTSQEAQVDAIHINVAIL